MTPTTIGQLFAIGLRVRYTGDMANASGHGAIVALDHTRTTVDIVLADGRQMRAVSISHLAPASAEHGCLHRYLVEDTYADDAEIAGLIANAATTQASASAKRDAAKAAYAAEVERLKAAHPELLTADTPQAATKNIRTLLKQFKGVKFSVTRKHYDSISICWTDGPTEAQVDAIVNPFSDGHFDGMDDCYHYSRTPWNQTFGGARWVNTYRDHSDVLIERAIADLVAEYGDKDRPSVEDFRQGRAYYVSPMANDDGAGGHWSWQSMIHRQLREIAQ